MTSRLIVDTALFPKGFDFLYTDDAVSTSVFEEEKKIVSGWKSSKSQVDFYTGRYCVHQLLSKKLIRSCPILKSSNGAPIFPGPYSGSISHTLGCWGAVITDCSKRVGLDIEILNREISFSLANRTCSLKERKWLESLPLAEKIKYTIVIFSLKESIYKCLTPDEQSVCAFANLNLSFEGNKVYLESCHLNTEIQVNYLIKQNLVFSGAWFDKK